MTSYHVSDTGSQRSVGPQRVMKCYIFADGTEVFARSPAHAKRLAGKLGNLNENPKLCPNYRGAYGPKPVKPSLVGSGIPYFELSVDVNPGDAIELFIHLVGNQEPLIIDWNDGSPPEEYFNESYPYKKYENGYLGNIKIYYKPGVIINYIGFYGTMWNIPIDSLPDILLRLSANDAEKFTASLANLHSNMISLELIGGQNVITGALSDMPASMRYLSLNNMPSGGIVAGIGPIQATELENITLENLTPPLSSSVIDEMLIKLAAVNWVPTTGSINLSGEGYGAPTEASAAARATLQSKNVLVVTN